MCATAAPPRLIADHADVKAPLRSSMSVVRKFCRQNLRTCSIGSEEAPEQLCATQNCSFS